MISIISSGRRRASNTSSNVKNWAYSPTTNISGPSKRQGYKDAGLFDAHNIGIYSGKKDG
jgi:hypothetical protein